MDCRLRLITTTDAGLHEYTCPRCHVVYRSTYTPDRIHRPCAAAKPKCSNEGPGTELERILKWFGVRVKRGCGCKDWVRWMNAIGVDGCREPANMTAISDRLKEYAHLAPRWAIRWLILTAIWRAS